MEIGRSPSIFLSQWKIEKAQLQYIGLSADLDSNIGVLSWHPSIAMSTFMLSTASIHEYIPLDAYIAMYID